MEHDKLKIENLTLDEFGELDALTQISLLQSCGSIQRAESNLSETKKLELITQKIDLLFEKVASLRESVLKLEKNSQK